jgi:biotin synthase
MQDYPQPPIGAYKRIQLARYLINHEIAETNNITFNERGQINDYGVYGTILNEVINSGLPFMTSGCAGKTMENACNRPFANCTPYQASMGKFRNYPFQPNEEDIIIIRKQLYDNSKSS